jgi:hypothetical protein
MLYPSVRYFYQRMPTATLNKMNTTFPIKENFAEVLFALGKKLSHAGVRSEKTSLCYRHGLGFVITSADAPLDRLTEKHLVLIEDCNLGNPLKVRGSHDPSPLFALHAAVFHLRSGAIFSLLVEASKLDAPKLPCLPSTSSEFQLLNEQMESLLSKGNQILVQNVGVLSFGCTEDDALTPIASLLKFK